MKNLKNPALSIIPDKIKINMAKVFLIKEDGKSAEVKVPDIIGMCIVKIAKITAEKAEYELLKFIEKEKEMGILQDLSPKISFYIYGDTFLPPTQNVVDFCAKTALELLLMQKTQKIKAEGEIIADVSDVFFLSLTLHSSDKNGDERKFEHQNVEGTQTSSEKENSGKEKKSAENTSSYEIDEAEKPKEIHRRIVAEIDDFFRIKDGVRYAKAVKIMQSVKNSEVMEKAFLVSPETTYISFDSEIEEGVLIYPDAVIISSFVGKGSVIGKGTFLLHSRVGQNTKILPYCYIEGADIEGESQVGPFARTRPNTVIRKNAKIGNFVEIKNSEIGEGSKAQHFSYIGDTKIGKNVNIGAGTVTCNYDGEKKSATEIRDNAFVGSGSMLVAPLEIGEWAYIAAGSTITKNVPKGALAIERADIKFIPEWGERKLKRKAEKNKSSE